MAAQQAASQVGGAAHVTLAAGGVTRGAMGVVGHHQLRPVFLVAPVRENGDVALEALVKTIRLGL